MNSTFALDQVRYAPSSPQIGLVSQGLWTPLQAALDSPQVSGLQPRFAPGAAGFLQSPSSALRHLLGPTVHRLPMHLDPPGHFCLGNSLPQQFGGKEAPLFQLFEVSLYPFWVSHAPNIAQEARYVTILFNTQ